MNGPSTHSSVYTFTFNITIGEHADPQVTEALAHLLKLVQAADQISARAINEAEFIGIDEALAFIRSAEPELPHLLAITKGYRFYGTLFKETVRQKLSLEFRCSTCQGTPLTCHCPHLGFEQDGTWTFRANERDFLNSWRLQRASVLALDPRFVGRLHKYTAARLRSFIEYLQKDQ